MERAFGSSPDNVRIALNDMKQAMARHGTPAPLADAAQIILGEVLNNVVEHAYGFEDGHPVRLAIDHRPDGLWCVITDQGRVMPNGAPPAGIMPQVAGTPRDDLPEGGFGWAMVREMTDGIRYTRADGENRLEFLIPA
nr:ATP-binding protein [Hasllibacter sp. MH4015]